MKQRALQHAGLVALVVALLLLRTSLTHAIINGTIDGNLHPNVGVVIFEVDGQLDFTVLGKPDCAHRLCYGGALPGIHRVPGCDSGVGLVRLARRRGCQFY